MVAAKAVTAVTKMYARRRDLPGRSGTQPSWICRSIGGEKRQEAEALNRYGSWAMFYACNNCLHRIADDYYI